MVSNKILYFHWGPKTIKSFFKKKKYNVNSDQTNLNFAAPFFRFTPRFSENPTARTFKKPFLQKKQLKDQALCAPLLKR